MNATVVVLHDGVPADAPADQLDTLAQAQAVNQALEGLDYHVERLALDLDLGAAARRLVDLSPTCVFNLAESVAGDGRLVHVPALLLETLRLPYTGCSSHALYQTTHKPLAKRLARCAGLPTPDWCEQGKLPRANDPGPWLVKPVAEEASIGIGAGALVSGRDAVAARQAAMAQRHGGAWFAERYVDGREFNVGLLDGPDGPQVLPIAEMRFIDYPAEVPRILDYAAKWEAASFAFRHTQRSFASSKADAELLPALARLAGKCWELFELRGYARVDFRVDAAGRPWILEVNANPCIAPDAGFMAAAGRADLDLRAVIARILGAVAR